MPLTSVIAILLSGLISALGTWALLPILKRHVLDLPNARSNHKIPVPRGGGIALVAGALSGFTLLGAPLPIIFAALLLAVVSFIDDRRGLPASVRFAVQFVAVSFALSSISGHIFPAFVPPLVETAILALVWLWFINLTNFMDGIDGISAMEAILVSAGMALLCFLHRTLLPPSLAWEALVMAAAAFGFYLFNKHPAKLFMGDVGSVPLGFLMGYLLLNLAGDGYPLPALILPAYYLADATLTLLRRLARGEKIWQAHSSHAYQRAVRAGLSHAQVVGRIAVLNLVLIALAIAGTVSMMAGVLSAVAAYGLTFRLIYYFSNETH